MAELGMNDDMGWCFTGVPPQGHIKVISRSLQSLTKKKHDFFGFYLFQTHLGAGDYYK